MKVKKEKKVIKVKKAVEKAIERPIVLKPYSYFFMRADDDVAQEMILGDGRTVIMNTTFEYDNLGVRETERLIIVQE